jgi:hypothetical protein
MLVWTLGLADALAAVRIEDSTGCFNPEAVELEVREAVGDATADDMELVVHLSGTESWQLALTVNSSAGTIWNRIVPVEPVDCPYLPELVAQSFERGLADLPDWGLHNERRWPELSFGVSGTLPSVLRVGFITKLWVPIAARYGWQFQLAYQQSSVQTVSLPGDVVQVAFLSAHFETGPSLDIPFDEYRVRIATRVSAGGGRATGRDFQDGNSQDMRPSAAWMTELLWVPDNHLRVGPRLEVGLVRGNYVSNTGQTIAREIPVRGGLVLELGGPLHRKDSPGDGSRVDR